MSYKLVHWALQRAPMLPAGRGGGTSARLNLIARCEEQRDGEGSHYLSIADLMFRTGLTAGAVKASTKALEDAGLIVRQGQAARGIPRYSINDTLSREDTVQEIRSSREQDRRHSKEPTPTGSLSTPVTGSLNDPPGTGSLGDPRVTESPGSGSLSDPTPVPVKETTKADALVGAEPEAKKRRKSTKPKDPAKDAAAHDLADRYYRAMSKQVNFVAVRGIVRKALDAFTAEDVMRGLKAMTEGNNRTRPLTRQTLLVAIEGRTQHQRGTTHATQPMPAVGEYPDDPLGATA